MSDKPRGALVAIGGNEDKTAGKDVLRRVIELPTRRTRHVEIIPTASRLAQEVADDYVRAFKDLGVEEVRVLDIRERADADNESFAERVHKCDVVYMTGGDQLRLTSVLGGTKVAQAILDTYVQGGVVAGTSAGAAAMSTTMIAGGDTGGAMRKGSVQMTPGLGLVRNCVIDTHFLDRGRVGRLLEVVSTNPGYLGLGVGEDTGILILDGSKVEVVGTGIVVVVEGGELRSSNVSNIGAGDPIAAERIIVHTLVKGYQYDMATREYKRPASDEKR